MGAGEQAVIKIIETVRSASKGSLIIVDEPEALLHHLVVERMLRILIKISKDKRLQILCSSHWSGLLTQENVQIYSIGQISGTHTPVLIQGPDKKILKHLFPATPKKLLWCEDSVAAAIMEVAIRKNGYQSDFKVVSLGSSSNAFSVAAHLALSDSKDELVILDGDADADLNTVGNKIKKALSGTESHIKNLRVKASSYFSALNPKGKGIPENFLLNAAKRNSSQLTKQMREELGAFQPPADVKLGFFDLAERLGLTPAEFARQISEEIKDTEDFSIYTSDAIAKCRVLLSEPPILANLCRCEISSE